VILNGSGKEAIAFQCWRRAAAYTTKSYPFEGVLANMERRYHESDSTAVREELAKYQNNKPCPACGGTRLREEARHVMVGGVPIFQVSAMPLKQVLAFFEALTLDGQRAQIADKIVKEIVARVGFLNNVGLDYLSLDRSADTLSGGESQRIRLASQIGSGLTGVMYVLDEPSIGLHQRDNDRLLAR
jgi:excinuclease ABC subunit A